jgi:hypothetical protein
MVRDAEERAAEEQQEQESQTRPRASLSRTDEDEFDFAYFQQAYRENPQRLFGDILKAIENRDTYQQRVIELEGQNRSMDRQIDALIDERNELKDKLVQMLLEGRSGTPASSQPVVRSTKLPDPPILTDGKDPKFEDWLLRIRDKLAVNVDHYPTDQIQRAYVVGRIGGEAATYIAPRLRPDSSDPYQTVADLYQHLTDIYKDPNRVYVAKDDFRKLYMKKQELFHTFYSTFTRIANEAQISPAELKYELNHKLPFDLQKQVLREFRDNSYTLKLFADYCSITDQTLRGIEERQTRAKRLTEKNQTNTGDRQATLPSPSSFSFRPQQQNRAYIALTNTTLAERQQLYKDGKCYYCKGVGHRALECRKKQLDQQPTEVKAIEGAPPESGNDDA